MVQAPEVITTARLVLRRPRLSDAEAIFEYASNPKVVHYMDYCPRTMPSILGVSEMGVASVVGSSENFQ